jgi:hypothetical protein
MQPSTKTYLLALSILCALTSNGQGLLGKVKNTLGSVVDAGVKWTTAPYQSIINSAQVVTGHGNPSSIYSPYVQMGQSAGNALAQANDLVNRPQNYIYGQALNFANQFGGPGKFVFDVGTFTNQFYSQLGSSATYAVSNALKGQNPFQVVAAPLAAAIRAARERHAVNIQPIPNEVRQALSSLFSASTLNRARYTIGSVEITLPNFIGQGQKFMGTDYAVVVDDIIVFNTTPNSLSWWVHELTHVEQYERMGVEAFAFYYAKDLGSRLEGEANSRAQAYNPQSTGGFGEWPTSTTVTATIKTSGVAALPQKELYVAQCFFPMDPNPVHYLVTNTGRIMAVDPINGQYFQVGVCTPPLDNVAAWTFQTPQIRYAVTPQGGIFTFDQFMLPNGQMMPPQPRQIGHVVNLQ